jgi:hypothetical protein
MKKNKDEKGYYDHQFYHPKHKDSDEFGYVHLGIHKGKCKHKITYPLKGLELELQNVMDNKEVEYCEVCNRYVID